MNINGLLMHKSQFYLAFTMVTASLLIFFPTVLVNAKGPYDSGYDHGCKDAGISDASDRYINQPEKGASFHTSEFMNGYNTGISSCSASHSQSGPQSTTSNSKAECNFVMGVLGGIVGGAVAGGEGITSGSQAGKDLCVGN